MMHLLLASIAAQALSGFLGRRVSTAFMILGAAGGLVAVASGESLALVREWTLPIGRISLALDAIGRIFLVPILAIPALGSVYGLGYWNKPSDRRLRLFYGIMPAAMAIVVLARDSVLFLMAWEAMALSAFFLVGTEDEEAPVRQASWVYLIAAHCGTLVLIALFTLMRALTGSTALGPMGGEMKSVVFVLAVVGFGLKAGLMPFHVWLPGAHANAPSHVSAVLSGVMIKMGVYGIVRIGSYLPAPPSWWGGLLLGAGAVSGVAGLAWAMGQRDFKRLLAYSSIENVGIIFLGLGLAMLGRAHARPEWIALGLGGALFHVWNHSIFKPLLFFGAGAVHHGTNTREIDHLGGLAKRMPWTAGAALVGAIAICGLPPFNGFAGEVLLYVGLFRSGSGAAFAAPVLAMIGALAVACFVKAGGAVFLGSARTPAAEQAHEAPASMTAPMLLLAAACVVLGLAPALAAGVLDRAVAEWGGGGAIGSLVPLRWVGAASAAVAAVCVAGFFALRRSPATVGTWDCGYLAPTARIQYTGSSSSQSLIDLFRWMLWPRRHAPRATELFAHKTGYKSLLPDLVLDRILIPMFQLADRAFPWIRKLQQGRVQLYLLYVLVAAVLLLLLG